MCLLLNENCDLIIFFSSVRHTPWRCLKCSVLFILHYSLKYIFIIILNECPNNMKFYETECDYDDKTNKTSF